MISERTRDKIAATRRKGKWSGGMPILGYTVVDTKLVVDETEAQRVREIFQLYDLLTNVAYIGKIRYKDEVHDGEQTPIVDERVFAETQTILKRNGRSGGRATRTKHAALLRGMLRCATCICAMSHSFTARGPRQYRCYVCQRAQTHGWDACPNPSIPAGSGSWSTRSSASVAIRK